MPSGIYNVQPRSMTQSIKDWAEIDDAKQRRQINALALQDRQRGIEEATAIQNAMAGLAPDATPEQAAMALRRLGPKGMGLADSLLKTEAEVGYKKAQAARERTQSQTDVADALKKSLSAYRDMLPMVRTRQDAVQWTAAQYQDPTTKAFVSRIPLEQMVQNIPEDEAGFNQWRQEVGMGIEKFVQSQTTKRGQDITAETSRANNAATNARLAADAAAGRGLQRELAGQADRRARDIAEQTDRRMRELAENKGAAKPIPARVVQDLQDARDSAATMDALGAEFKDEYAGKGVIGVGSDLQLDIASRLGVDKGSVLWWKDYRKMVELVERHAKFGASLSKAEQASWRSADINPGMDSEIIKKNLATRSSIAKKVLENTAQDAIDSGHAEDRVQAIANRTGAAATLKTDSVPSDIAEILKKHGKKP